ncbi:MAG: hypothetical protein WB392_05395 [Methanotrichaceae archaeon]
MNNQLISLISLLGIIAAISITTTIAQENNITKLNNISQKNGTFSDININLSDMNNNSINETDFNKSLPLNKDAFVITGNVTAMPMNGVGLEISAKSSAIQPPKKATFVINGYTRPKTGAIYENLSLLNAAYLSRGVEGTPHGYVTYYN